MLLKVPNSVSLFTRLIYSTTTGNSHSSGHEKKIVHRFHLAFICRNYKSNGLTTRLHHYILEYSNAHVIKALYFSLSTMTLASAKYLNIGHYLNFVKSFTAQTKTTLHTKDFTLLCFSKFKNYFVRFSLVLYQLAIEIRITAAVS